MKKNDGGESVSMIWWNETYRIDKILKTKATKNPTPPPELKAWFVRNTAYLVKNAGRRTSEKYCHSYDGNTIKDCFRRTDGWNGQIFYDI